MTLQYASVGVDDKRTEFSNFWLLHLGLSLKGRNLMNCIRFLSAWFAAITVACIASSASATLVYEGFDMGAVGGNLGGKAVSGTGLTGNWAVGHVGGSNTPVDWQYDPNGFTFSNLIVNGGKASSPLINNGDTFARANFLANPTATWYGSYLANYNETHQNFSVEVPLGSYRFRVNHGPGAGQNVPSTQVGANSTVGTAVLADNTTFMTLFKATGLNSGNPAAGTGEMWILTEDQFANFKAGGLTEVELNAAAIGATATDVTWKSGLVSDGAMNTTVNRFEFVRGRGNGGVDFDEYRLSDVSLDDVTPIPVLAAIPEPSTLALGIIGLLGLCTWRRRKRS